MTDPITPPPELLQQWWEQADQYQDDPKTYFDFIVTEVAQWGADQELEACVEWVSQWRCMVGGNRPEVGLRAARRPKPPSLKEQALAALKRYEAEEWCEEMTFDSSIIRRALEALPND